MREFNQRKYIDQWKKENMKYVAHHIRKNLWKNLKKPAKTWDKVKKGPSQND